MFIPHLLLAFVAGLAATACATGTGGPADPPAPARHPATRFATVDEAVQAARTDAARRQGVAAAAVELLSAERVTWPDGSIGCPQPGVVYTMALVPGYRVQLRVPGAVLDYHASLRGALLLCPPGQSAEPAGGTTR